jgi:hypothetical protein
MPYVRPLVPAIPLMYVLLVAAADDFAARGGGFRKAVMLAYIVSLLIDTLFFAPGNGYFGAREGNALREQLRSLAASPRVFAGAIAAKLRSPSQWGPLDGVSGQTSQLSNYQTLVGNFLHRNYPPNSLVIYDQMGQTPFYAGATMRFIDSLGLTDRTIGRFYFERWKRSDALLRTYDVLASQAVQLAFGERRDPITETSALNYLFDLNPDLILLNEVTAFEDPAGIPVRLSQDPRLANGYELRYTLAGFVDVYERKSAPRKQRLEVPTGLWVLPR